MINPNEFENLKKVLFGNQVQASIINDAVVGIVYRYIYENHLPGVNLDTEDAAVVTVCSALSSLMLDATKLSYDDEIFIRLVAGDSSYNNVMSGEPAISEATQPNPESPKRLFRIHIIGVDSVSEETETTLPKVHLSEISGDSDTASLRSKAEQIYKMIEPVIPDTIKQNVPDKYAQALLVAKVFFTA